MSKAVRIIAILIVILALAGAGFMFRQRQQAEAEADVAPATVPVSRGDIQELVSATGNVAADRQTTLTFASSGTIEEVLVEKGQEVQAGDVLAALDTSSLEWQIARSEAALATALSRLEQAQQPASESDLASAQAALDNAQANYENVKDGAPDADLASAQAGLDSAQANLKKVKDGPTKDDLAAAQAALDTAQAQVRQAQAAYDRVKYVPDIAQRQESLNLENATIQLEQAQANYNNASKGATASEIAAAEAQVAQAEAQIAALLDQPSESALAAAQAQIVQAEASLAALLDRPRAEDVAVSQAQVDEATVALAQAEAQLEDATIVAPFAGAILSVQIREGEWGSPGAPAIVMAATEPLILEANIDEIDVAMVSEGQTARLSFDALKGIQSEAITGAVTYIAPASTNVGGAVAYPIDVSFTPGELPVRLGMTADVDIVVAAVDDALLVPNQAIESDRAAGRYFVSTPRLDGTSQRVEVVIGLRDENQAQILEGLQEGDLVILPQVPEQIQEVQRFGGPPGDGEGGGFGGR
jgi:HlyD family secretion protein